MPSPAEGARDSMCTKWGSGAEVGCAPGAAGTEGRAHHDCLRKASRGALLHAHRPAPQDALTRQGGTWGPERPGKVAKTASLRGL